MLLSRRQLGAVSGVALLAACSSRQEHPAPRPAGGHPRLLVRQSDLDRLRQWASDANPVYRDGLSVLAGKAKKSMEEGHVPAEDAGSDAYETYPTEWYAELFAFMSLIERDQSARDDYGHRARNLLMHIIDKASAGAGADGEPFRGPRFATFDRSRWNGEAFGLTVDWAYAYFSADDKRRIREVFLRWSAEQFAAYPSEQGGGGAADFRKDGPFNDPAMLTDQTHVRWAMNNYYNAHMRNMGLMAMALDSGDDPDNRVAQLPAQCQRSVAVHDRPRDADGVFGGPVTGGHRILADRTGIPRAISRRDAHRRPRRRRKMGTAGGHGRQSVLGGLHDRELPHLAAQTKAGAPRRQRVRGYLSSCRVR